MAFEPVRKLEVWRTLSQGSQVQVGLLAQNAQGVFFQYDPGYLAAHPDLSPFGLEETLDVQQASREPHEGLHGCFADSVPDGWGRLLQDRALLDQDVLPALVTPMDRLAMVGEAGMGALGYRPASDYRVEALGEADLQQIGLQAQALFDETPDKPQSAGGDALAASPTETAAPAVPTQEQLGILLAAGSSGGARPKASVYFSEGDFTSCRTQAGADDEAWLVKFTSKRLPLGHEEGLCEAAYLTLADRAGLKPPEWRLLPAPAESGASQWLGLKRFDCTRAASGEPGRLHLLSACGLLDADFRSPSLDYEALIKASVWLCKAPAAGQLQFRRAMFNLLACNQDDHSRNWAFLQDDEGGWTPAPFYDVTFSPHPFGEHATAYKGHGKAPPLRAAQALAEVAGFANWRAAQRGAQEVAEAVWGFGEVAKELGVGADVRRLVGRQLDRVWRANKGLVG